MEMTDLKAAIDDYTDTAESGLMAMKDRLDMLETKLARPGAASDFGGEDATEHKAAFFDRFIQKGDTDALKALEAKALTTGGDGGYAVPMVIDSEIEKQLRILSPLRSVVKVKTIETADYKRLVNTGGAASGWVGEEAARGETAAPSLQQVVITPGELYANAAATQRALDDMQFDAEAWLSEEVAEEFAAQEGAAIVNGTGAANNMPQGFLTYTQSTNDDDTRAFGELQYIPTGMDAAFPASDPADILIDLVHALSARYRQGAHFVMNSKTLATVRKFKDADGNFIWRAGLAEGQPDTLLGYPVLEVEDMPDIGTDSASIAFGNFERAYTLVERTGTRVLRDPYTNKPYVHFYATRRVGGALVNDHALKLLKFGVA
ncbi:MULTISPECIES: phage major capsid protein [Kordiimonas]|uniref:phage major capsid protein n=1 Tax=Kordiimonas TaxID=288021 RepID=UPI00257AD149|nr:phage major capsid protein [Kordiimonas sp. UBA4487]